MNYRVLFGGPDEMLVNFVAFKLVLGWSKCSKTRGMPVLSISGSGRVRK